MPTTALCYKPKETNQTQQTSHITFVTVIHSCFLFSTLKNFLGIFKPNLMISWYDIKVFKFRILVPFSWIFLRMWHLYLINNYVQYVFRAEFPIHLSVRAKVMRKSMKEELHESIFLYILVYCFVIKSLNNCIFIVHTLTGILNEYKINKCLFTR